MIVVLRLPANVDSACPWHPRTNAFKNGMKYWYSAMLMSQVIFLYSRAERNHGKQPHEVWDPQIPACEKVQ